MEGLNPSTSANKKTVNRRGLTAFSFWEWIPAVVPMDQVDEMDEVDCFAGVGSGSRRDDEVMD